MATYGLSATGFLIPTVEEIRDSINQDLFDAFGTSIDLNNGILARFVGILAERYSLLWEQLEAVYNSQNPDTASGFALDALCLLTGTLRIEAIFSTVVLTLTGSPTTLVPAAQQVSTKSNGGVNKFLTAEPGTIVALPSYTNSTLYAQGVRFTANGKCYQVLTTGTSAVSGTGPAFGVTGQTSTGTDGTVGLLYLGDGTGAVDVEAQSADKGPIIGAARDIIQIDQPYGGWSGVINVLDAHIGYDDQNDESLRISRDEELGQAGTSTADAIRAALLSITGVTAVTVFHNDTDTTDGDGVTPHSIEALVQGGDDADIGAVLLQQVAAGINTVGNVTTTPLDSQGVAQTIRFSRPAVYNIGVTITLIKQPNVSSDTTTYPLDGDAQVKAAIVAYGNAQKAGRNVVSSALMAQAFKVAGVLEVSSVLISSVAAMSPGLPAPPSPSLPTTIPISTRQLAQYDTSWITVVTSDGTP